VRDIRRRAGLSQRALAARAGVPQPTIAELEAGRREPSITLLSRLAEATGYELKLSRRFLRHSGARVWWRAAIVQ
jgi:transcriptional regulator with XRE-family HTH domain